MKNISIHSQDMRHQWVALGLMFAFFAIAPYFVYPVFLMKVMCFALFACAFNLLLGFGGLLSFGHAMFFGTAGYAAAHAAKEAPPVYANKFNTRGFSPTLSAFTLS